MADQIKPSTDALREALLLSTDLLRGIELGELSLTQAALRASRLARLLNDFQYQRVFEYEAGGYPGTPTGVVRDIWALIELAGRTFQQKDKDGKVGTYGILESIEQLEAQVDTAKLGLDAARDASISSANPNQIVSMSGNAFERTRLHNQIASAVKRLGGRRTFLYWYVLQKNLELKFSGIAGDAFSRIREFVDGSIGASVPSAVQKFSAIYENLNSGNPEDWSNAVHGCRRVLQDLADVLFPATETPRQKVTGTKTITVALGADNYINRLVCYAEDHAGSGRTEAIIGSHLEYLGNRLDALFKAAQKGSHAVISDREEADRYVVYTYMIVGDLLRLQAKTSVQDSTVVAGGILPAIEAE